MIKFLLENKEWLFSGLGMSSILLIISIFKTLTPNKISNKNLAYQTSEYQIHWLNFLLRNKEWLFSGIGICCMIIILNLTTQHTKIKKDNTILLFQEQIQTLNNVENNLQNLTSFIKKTNYMNLKTY